MEWNASPILFNLGPISIRYYSLMFIIGFISMSPYVKRIFKENSYDPKLVDSLTNYIIIGMLVGSRLAHCLFYDPIYYLSNPLEILMIWKGGLASHGGYLGLIFTISLFIKKNPQINYFWLMDNVGGPALFVGGLIRIGNFFNSEIAGTPSDVPWAIIFKKLDNIPRHPTQLYEALGYFTIALLLMFLAKKKFKTLHTGAIFSIGLILSFLFRFFIEFFKDNQSMVSTSWPINMGQSLSLALIAAGMSLFFFTKKKFKS